MRNPSSPGVNKSALRTDNIVLVLLVIMLATLSCNRRPARVSQPSIAASSAADAAMEMCDANSDGVISGAELEKSPGLKAALTQMDTNHDNGVSSDEISARIQQWQTMKTGLMSFAFTVTLDGRPLENATVNFVPEPFLGDEIKGAVSTTNLSGRGRASVPKEDRPDPQTTPPGVYLGLYRVKISRMVGGRETIPAKYNDQTTLGQEVAPDVREIAGNRVIYSLTTK